MTKNNKFRFMLDVYSNLTGIVRFALTVPVLTLLGISAFLLISNFKNIFYCSRNLYHNYCDSTSYYCCSKVYG